jgi:ribosomal protein S18 acetylase RimI-like enzyme
MHVVPASREDIDGFLALAAEVENWFGSMIGDPNFHAMLEKNIERGTAYVARAEGTGVLGAILTGGQPPAYRINWLVVAAPARGQGVGRALVSHAVNRFDRPCQVDVITFGEDNPAAIQSGARAFYERLGFHPGEEAPTGPEGGSRQWHHLLLTE